MAVIYNPNDFQIDFSSRDDLTKDEKQDLQLIQESFRPVERVEYLIPYRIEGKISDDDFEHLTGVPCNFE